MNHIKERSCDELNEQKSSLQIKCSSRQESISKKLQSCIKQIKESPFEIIMTNNYLKTLINYILKSIILIPLTLSHEFISVLWEMQRFASQRGCCIISTKRKTIFQNYSLKKPSTTTIKDGSQKYYQHLQQQKEQFIIQSREELSKIQKAPPSYMTPKSLNIYYNNHSYFPHLIENCLYCSKQWRQNEPFPQTKQVFTMMSRTKYNELQFQERFKSKICAVLNSGGGYIFITVEENGKVNGADWLYGQQQLWKQYTEHCYDFIFPSYFRIDVKEITIKHDQQKQGKQKAMIRITLISESTRIAYFVRKTVPKYPPVFYYYFLDLSIQSKSQDLLTVVNHGQIYKIILDKNRKFNSFWSNQANGYPIKYSNYQKQWCVPPLSQRNQLQIFSIKNSKAHSTKGKTEIEMKTKQEQTPITSTKYQKVEQGQIKVLYKHQSILILANEASDAIIQEIERLLISSKLTFFRFFKPYTTYRDQSIKSIWFITHQFAMENIQKILPKAEEQKPGCKPLALITATKYLNLQKVKQEQKLPNYFELFKMKFGQQPKKKKYKTNLKEHFDFYLKFNTFQENNCRLRTYFCKEHVYLEKQAHMVS